MPDSDPNPVTDKLSLLWRDRAVETLPFTGQKIVILSDVHLGNGGDADDSRHNERVIVDALLYYAKNAYTLILLGDIEEFWQFDLADIVRRYDASVYLALREFADGKVHRVFGNHDREWGALADPARRGGQRVGCAAEAIQLTDAEGAPRFLLVHGHQGSIDADKYAWMSRFFVRLFQLVEPAAKWIGIYGDKSATKSQVTRNYERMLYTWAKAQRVILICGHSHRAIFASKSHAQRIQERVTALQSLRSDAGADPPAAQAHDAEIAQLRKQWQVEKRKGRVITPVEPAGIEPLPCYFNSGCACYTDGLTTIEVCEPEIRLVKWERTSAGPSRRTVYNTGQIAEMVTQVTDQS